MSTNDNYPPGAANDPYAPYNDIHTYAEDEVEVTVSVTLSKVVTVKVSDYTFDDEGLQDFSDCDLKGAVKNQVTLPQEAYKHLLEGTKLREDLEGWDVDDFEVILE